MTLSTQLLSVAAVSLLGLIGCVGGGAGNANRYATVCMAEVNPAGEMLWRDGDDTVIGGKFATLEGIEGMNACISRKAAADGLDVPSAPMSQRSTAVTSGNTVVETYTYGQPPASAAASGIPKPENCRARTVMSGGSGYNQCIR